jgi:TonB family protein
MNPVLNYLWEGSICLVVLYGFYHIFLTKHTFFGWNRAYLLASLGLALIIPLLSFEGGFSMESNLLSTNPIYFLPEFEFSTNAESQTSPLFSLPQILMGIYGVGFLTVFVRFSIGLFQIFRRIQASEKHYQDGYTIVINPSFQPSSFFHYVFLPQYNPGDHDHQLILAHEFLHGSHYHTLDLMFFQLMKMVFWFHPVLKFVESSLCEVHEYQVDDEVTKSHAKDEYAYLLLKLVIAERGKQLMNNFNQFQTKKRILMMKKNKSNLLQKTRFMFAIPLMALLVIAFSCEESQEEALPLMIDIPIDETVLESVGGEIFDVVEVPPNPPGGMEGWSKYLGENLKYPTEARNMGIEVTVYVVFVINSDGSITNPEILRGIGGGCDEEALRVVKNSPNWDAGTQRARKVNVRMRLPIRFKLS